MKSLLYSVAGQLIINALKKLYFSLFLPVAEKGTIKSGRNQDEKTKVSGENFYNYLSYNILHHLNEILWIKGKGHENIV